MLNFSKYLITKKRIVIYKPMDIFHHYSTIATRSLVQKKTNPAAFIIPCMIGAFIFSKVLWDLGESINLMLLVIYQQLDFRTPKLTFMHLLMANCLVKRLVGIFYNVLVEMENFIFSTNFVILDCKVDFKVPIILGRPFL